jgi:2,5-dioxopentanoate dehydrogenase
MSSINPVVLMPGALAAHAETLGAAFVASLTLGAGQFCTNPGLVIAVDGPDLDRFVASASAALASAAAPVMLTPGIRSAYEAGVAALDANPHAKRTGPGAFFETTADAFVADPTLGHEVFGVSSLLVRCADLGQVAQVIDSLEGQLTATLQVDPDDADSAAPILARLREKVGRVLANGWPTGVEVTHAMVHGGPYPATSDGRTTSVGTLAMERFLRPVCYQDLLDALLPPALQAANPWGLRRRTDGVRGVS